MTAPIYTAENCKAAYQINWALSLFWHTPPDDAAWLPELQAATEPDGVRVLEHRFVKAGVSQLLLSTRPEIDLGQSRQSAHAIYWYNLHVCFVTDGRWKEVRHEVLSKIRAMILRASEKKGHLLSHAALVPDHVHLALGCSLAESPADVALSYMNNLAYACGRAPVFAFGFYAGTFGEYDLGVTWL